MKTKLIFVILLTFFISVSPVFTQENNKDKDNFPILSGPYLGQKPPGMTPEIFAPGIISTDDDEGCSAFLNNGTIFVFNRLGKNVINQSYIPIYVMKMKNGLWTKPYPAPFQNKQNDDNFTLAPDGKTLYFQSNRAQGSSVNRTDYSYIWYVSFTRNGWTKPHLLRKKDDSAIIGGYPSITKDGSLYLMSSFRKGHGKLDIFKLSQNDGKYEDAVNIGSPPNSAKIEIDSFISPDESYILFCSDISNSRSYYDLFAAFRKPDGSWTAPIDMGEEINAADSITRPSVTPDGKYLFFCRHYVNKSDDIYWVDAKIIDDLKPDHLK